MNDQDTGISSSFAAKGSVKEISGDDCYFDLSGLNLTKDSGDILTVRLVLLKFNAYEINPGLNYKFRY